MGKFLKIILSATVLSLIGNGLQCYQTYLSRENYKDEVKKYKEQLAPEINCYYKYFYYSPNKESYKFIINNIGSIDCKSIWAQEEIYLIIGEQVYEGEGVPHFNYFVYNGSRTHMWDLEKEKEREIDIVGLQIEAFNILKDNFNPTIISKWKITFLKENSSKRYYYEKYFVFDFYDRIFKDLKDYVGGVSCENKIRDYLSSGKKSCIDIFSLTGDFEVNPPSAFIINPDYSIKPVSLWEKISIDDLNNSLLFSGVEGFEIQPSDDVCKGTICYEWKLENNMWEKVALAAGGATVWSKPIPVMAYLLDKDAEKVRADPHLLKKNFQIRIFYKRRRRIKK
ncbi:MAG: hypothetical protein AYP45_09450 [Candidatus Brocadia carolinensis]|uniref:Uncharacterized protein n=1 Tax=Candidatus Brocadia carolinensis TaxID=1004156 RepID=A0A1V4AT06_9BACT|nr:MAG: hypothetical protein AYP45_09450 [Candidatus Brocadia caroliniensis]